MRVKRSYDKLCNQGLISVKQRSHGPESCTCKRPWHTTFGRNRLPQASHAMPIGAGPPRRRPYRHGFIATGAGAATGLWAVAMTMRQTRPVRNPPRPLPLQLSFAFFAASVVGDMGPIEAEGQKLNCSTAGNREYMNALPEGTRRLHSARASPLRVETLHGLMA